MGPLLGFDRPVSTVYIHTLISPFSSGIGCETGRKAGFSVFGRFSGLLPPPSRRVNIPIVESATVRALLNAYASNGTLVDIDTPAAYQRAFGSVLK